MDSLKLGNISFQIQIVRKTIRSIRLRLVGQNTISISAPHLTPDFIIKRFILDNQNWILKEARKSITSINLTELKKLTINGSEYSLDIKSASRDSLLIFDDQKVIHLHTAHLTNSHLKKIFESHFRPYALKIIKNELRLIQQKYHFSYNQVTVRSQTSRFGSCSSSGNLSFNWQIIFFPKAIFRHILFHEVAHLTHHDHSSNFWKLLAIYEPEWRLNRLWLKKEGSHHFLIKP